MGVAVETTDPVVINRNFGRLGSVRFASRLSVQALDARPRIINGEDDAPDQYRAAGYRQIITPAHIARWDIAVPERVDRMHGKWRNQLRKGQVNNLKICETTWDGSAHWLFDNATALAKKRRFHPLSTIVLSAFARSNPGAAILFEAHHQNDPLAACLVLRHGNTATYQTAWTSDTGKALQAPRVLLDHVAERLAIWGHTSLDLGLVETDSAAGLARFKMGTGAKLVRLGGTWVHMGRTRPLAPTRPIA